MIRPSAFSPFGYQAATFYANLQFSAAKVLPKLQTEAAGELDGEPVLLPNPDAPAFVPRLMLPSSDGSLRVEVSLQRLDVRWNRRPDASGPTLENFCRLSSRVFAAFDSTVASRPGRLALIVQQFQIHTDPGRELATHFCRPELLSNEPQRKGPLNRPENFELHAHKVFELGPFRVNSWVRCKSGIIIEGQTQQRVITVENDLNTLAEELETREFSEPEISDFLSRARTEIDTIASVYFPEDQE